MRAVVEADKRRAAQRWLVERIIAGDLVDPEYAENFWRYRHAEDE
jgi:hypothetical protein